MTAAASRGRQNRYGIEVVSTPVDGVDCGLRARRRAPRGRGRTASTYLSPDHIQYSRLELPDMPDQDLPAAVRWQVSSSQAEDVGANFYDYYDLGVATRDGKKRRSLIAVTSSEAVIDRLGHIARDQGLGLALVGDETGLLSQFQANHVGSGLSGVSAVLHIGAEKTSLMLVGNGKVLDARQLMRGTRWLESQVLRAASKKQELRRPGDDLERQEHTDVSLRLGGLLTREWLQSLRIASHHSAELAGKPVVADEVAIYAPRRYSTSLVRAWREQSEIKAVDLNEALSLYVTEKMHSANRPALYNEDCQIAFFQASEQVAHLQEKLR